MKALILAAFATLSPQLSTTQDLRLPDREVTLQSPCRDAQAVLDAARAHGLSVLLSMQVPAGAIMVLTSGAQAAVILVHDGYACLLGAGEIAPASKPQKLEPKI